MHSDTPQTLWPGDPSTRWAQAATTRRPAFVRPERVPRPESADEVARWEDPNGFDATELYHAPIFWVCLPAAALGVMIHGAITNPTGIGWSGNVFGESVQAGPWSYWIVWVAVILWLIGAIAVLVFRVRVVAPDIRKDAEWIYAHGVAHSIHPSPYTIDDGEGGYWPTFIAIDHRLREDKATRVFRALDAWLSQPDVQGALKYGSLRGRAPFTSEELFGPPGAGGLYLGSIPGFGSAGAFLEHEWVLITDPREPVDDRSDRKHVTTVPTIAELRKIRARLHRKAERRSPR
ncbi:hypothetical protein [Microbacterium sp. NPDC056234]|uniref:hypothetical protein n=1 Tax=Microbacterium sp. NPDC056234 TaxID=3345757 RepID=UPI0035D998BF